MIITDSQIEHMNNSLTEKFISDVCTYFEESDKYSKIPFHEMLEIVTFAIKQATLYNLTEKEDVIKYTLFIIDYGKNFETLKEYLNFNFTEVLMAKNLSGKDKIEYINQSITNLSE
jgi:hypothetical protein